ncbi:glycogenin-1, partial [Trichonephila clavata]
MKLIRESLNTLITIKSKRKTDKRGPCDVLFINQIHSIILSFLLLNCVTKMDQEAFVTCATNDTYALGALVLAQSLRNVQTSRKLAVIITPDVSDKIKGLLRNSFDVVKEVDVLDSRDEANLALLTRPDLGITFTKFNCWRLTQFQKCVFLDADII